MFVKIHEQIFSSSIMEEDLEVRYIWFCLLTLADKEGFIDMTIPAIARRINLDDEIVSNAIDKFMKPDPTSRTHTQDGKRLEKIRDSFGWKIINYIYYRDLRSEENRREYMRDYMRKQRDVSKKVNANVNSKQCKHPLAHTDTDTDTDTDTNNRVGKSKKFIPPTIEDVTKYIQDNKYHVNAIDFFKYFSEGKWIDSKGNPVRNWKQKIITWENHLGTEQKQAVAVKLLCTSCNTVFNERETTYDHDGKKICGKCDMKITRERLNLNKGE